MKDNQSLTLKYTAILSLILFFVLTITFGVFDGKSDGFTRIGIPIVFIQDTGGKYIDRHAVIWFKLHYLLLDIIIFIGVSFLIIKSYKYIKSR